MSANVVQTSLLSPPQVAIVIPVFKHSVLVAEAITCALQQDTDYPTVVVIVNDGCPFSETDRVCRDFALAHPDQIVYLYRKNGGLSAARNTGIDFALAAWSSVEAIYFLDADNRISPKTIEQSFRTLQEHPEVGWIYPTIQMFGQEYQGDWRGEYSALRHLRFNTCEAGSLVRRALLEAGCRYDETMKMGFEDWEFWWQAIEAGFRGKHLPQFGFQYRKRPESMLKDSERHRESILFYMRRKHRHLFSHDWIVQLEQIEAPRYAIFLADTEKVILTSDPTHLDRSMSRTEFRRHYHQAQCAPVRYHRPPFMVFTHSSILHALQKYHLLRWVFWRLESAQENHNVATLNIDRDATGLQVQVRETAAKTHHVGETDQVVMTTADLIDSCLQDDSDRWIQSLVTPEPLPTIWHVTLKLPGGEILDALEGGALYQFLYTVKDLHRQKPQSRSWSWQVEPYPPRSHTFRDSRWALESEAIYPVLKQPGERHIGFTLPILAFGGVEKIALNIARIFKSCGWKVHLFVFDTQMQDLPEWARVFETINFFHDSMMNQWGGTPYFGSYYDNWSQQGNPRLLKGFMAWLDVVINFHTSPLHGAIALLRQVGVKTVIRSEVHDLSPWNRACGHTYLMLGYEHAYDFVIPNSQQMLNWCHGMGVPEDKLVLVSNACGYPLESATLQSILERRWQRPFDGKLRVLFLGRFDRQKGLDRLVQIVTSSRHHQLPIQWRLVGQRVIEGENDSLDLESISDLIEPPALTSEALNEVYEWADVLLLPSYWEGLPLTILEAMRLGVVVCASDVGAVAEAIEHQKNGFLIANDNGNIFVRSVLNLFNSLLENPVELRRLQKAAAISAAHRSWETACASLVQKLENEIEIDRSCIEGFKELNAS
jgi:glycosyltransferase involved in cell wall biosynthesis